MMVSRTWLALGASALFAAAAFQDAKPPVPVVLGAGPHRYEWVRDWAKLPTGMSLGNTHGCVLVDSKGRVYVNTDTENAVIVFDADGKFLRAWGRELAGGLHGMSLVKEGDEEFFYLAHTARHEVLKATLDGKILWTLGWPEKSGVYASANEFLPTSIALAPNGDLFVADGYGKSWVHQFDSKREYVRSWGGPGSEVGKLATPHGLWLDTRGEKPVLLVADRENHRVQSFDLDGKPLGIVASDLRRPCHLHQRGSELVVADLAGRITLLDAKNAVLEHLGDNPDEALRAQNGVPREKWRDGEFLSPHCACFDAAGNIYIVDWNYLGRINKLRRVE
jgi:DNA-binding beta-propeller fold protein YncE